MLLVRVILLTFVIFTLLEFTDMICKCNNVLPQKICPPV